MWAAGTDMSVLKAGLCNMKEWHSTHHILDIFEDERLQITAQSIYCERQGRSPKCRASELLSRQSNMHV